MKSATGKIDIARISKLLCSAFFITGALIWLLTISAYAATSHIDYKADDALGSDRLAFDLVQAAELETSLPVSLGEIIPTMPESLKLDLSTRVSQLFRRVFEADTDGKQDFEPFILIDENKSRKLADVPESLIPVPAAGEEAPEDATDNLEWSIFGGEDGPRLRRQMYRTDI